MVILHADPSRGGAERYTVDLAEALSRRGHELRLLASSFAPGALPAGAVQLRTGRGSRAGQYMQFLDQFDRHLAAHPYDIVHAMLPVRQCDVYHPHAGIAAESIRSGHLKYQGPVMQVLSRMANRMNLRRQRFAMVEKALLTGPRPPVVLCLSEYVKSNLLRHYALPPMKMATLFNAVDLQKFDPAARPNAGSEIRGQFNIPPERVVALMIAQDFARKGLAEAIQAVARLNDPRLALLVVGKQNPASYRKLVKSLNVSDRVIFAGKTSDPYAFYSAADFFVLPTRHDPCSLVVLEALAMGLPVISTVFNGACEIMADGKQGYIMPDPADVSALSERMRLLMNDSARARAASECLFLRQRLAYDGHVDALLQIYQRAMTPKY